MKRLLASSVVGSRSSGPHGMFPKQVCHHLTHSSRARYKSSRTCGWPCDISHIYRAWQWFACGYYGVQLWQVLAHQATQYQRCFHARLDSQVSISKLKFLFQVNQDSRKLRHFLPLPLLMVRDSLSGSLGRLYSIYKLIHFLLGLSNGSARRVYLWQVLMRESCNPILGVPVVGLTPVGD